MFATIRRYTPKPGFTTTTIEELRRQIHDSFLPMIQDLQGFHGYYAINVEDRELVTITLCETRTAVTESTVRAAEFVRANPLPVEVGRPEVTDGEVFTFAEAAREVGAH